MTAILNDFFNPIKDLDPKNRRSLIIVSVVSFLNLFAYPIVRSSTTSIFLENEGAKKSPLVWLLSVVILSLAVTLYNKTQIKHSIHKLYLGTTLFSFVFFLVVLFANRQGIQFTSYALYIWKEVYIVLVIPMAFGFMNTLVSIDVAKILYGPIGALGSIGGILGGLLTSKLSHSLSTDGMLVLGAFLVLASGIVFWMTDHSFCISNVENNVERKKPVESTKGIHLFVILLIAIIVLSQFTINIANYKFNLLFSDIVVGKDAKTAALGKIYSSINAIGLCFSLFIVPIALKFTSLRNVLFSIPLIFLSMSLWGFTLSANVFFPVAATFALFKGVDYSLFSTAKELMYFGLTPTQKYGAKYLVDMVFYRASKGLISFVLLFVTSPKLLSVMLYLFLVLWLILIIPLMNTKGKILNKLNNSN